MCPACMAGAGLMLASVISTGGLAALIVRFQSEMVVNKNSAPFLSKENKS
jgi:hypothetical protein